jgi:hypothetical protein
LVSRTCPNPPPQGFVNSIVLLLYQKLEGQLEQMWEMVVQQPLALNGMPVESQQMMSQQQQQQQQAGGGVASPAGAGNGPDQGSFVAGRPLAGAEGGGSSLLPPAAGGGGSFVHDGSGVNRKMFSKRSCTEAMLKVLQHEIRKTHARSQNIE